MNVRDADTQRRKLVRGFAAAVERIAHRLCELGHAAGYRIDARINEVARIRPLLKAALRNAGLRAERCDVIRVLASFLG